MNNEPLNKNNSILLEICANSVTSALAAQTGGASRVELCGNLYEGGTTPSHGEIIVARKQLHIKLNVLIRPRGGDFLYSDIEIDVMAADIQYCAEAGCDGVVIGMLNIDGTVNKEGCKRLISIAKQHGLSVTFHRAIDMCADINQALEDIIELGCDHILTSGGKTTAIEGAGAIARLIKNAKGRIIIMPGSGVNENNVADLIKYTGANEIHSTAKTRIPSKMIYMNENILMGDRNGNEYVIDGTDVEKVRQILKFANR